MHRMLNVYKQVYTIEKDKINPRRKEDMQLFIKRNLTIFSQMCKNQLQCNRMELEEGATVDPTPSGHEMNSEDTTTVDPTPSGHEMNSEDTATVDLTPSGHEMNSEDTATVDLTAMR